MKKKFLISCLIVVFVIGCMITLAFLMKDQIRDWSKKHIFYKVTKQEDELSRLIGRYAEKDKNVLIHLDHEDNRVIPYKKLNDEEISKVFNEFHLMAIRYDEDENMIFYIYPYMGLLIEGYSNGFYYSPQDEPIGGWGEEIGDLEFEDYGWKIYRWYKTEKILDHWWYFEEILLIE